MMLRWVPMYQDNSILGYYSWQTNCHFGRLEQLVFLSSSFNCWSADPFTTLSSDCISQNSQWPTPALHRSRSCLQVHHWRA
jgi:hypothetical protein